MTTWVTELTDRRNIEMVLYGNGDIGLQIVEDGGYGFFHARLTPEAFESLRGNVEKIDATRESIDERA